MFHIPLKLIDWLASWKARFGNIWSPCFYTGIFGSATYLCLLILSNWEAWSVLKEPVENNLENKKFLEEVQLTENNSREERSEAFLQKKYNGFNRAGRSDSSKIWPRDKNLSKIMDSGSSGQVEPYRRPWPTDPTCKNVTIHFAPKNAFVPTALVSFPGSGNTWIRYLIEMSSGYFTGSIFNDATLDSKGFLGELGPVGDGRTVVQKTHSDALYRVAKDKLKIYVDSDDKLFQYRGILIIRNPFNALLSYWNFRSTRNHTGASDFLPDHNHPDWLYFVRIMMEKWAGLIMTWVKKSKKLLIVEYEKMKENTRSELMRILSFLNIRIDGDRFRCLFKHPSRIEGLFHRRHKNISNNLPTFLFHDKSQVPLYLHSFPDLIIIKRYVQIVNEFFTAHRIPIYLNYFV